MAPGEKGKPYILYVGSHGVEDTYRAGLLFAAANSMKAHVDKLGLAVGVKVALLGDAVFLVKKDFVKNAHFPGRPVTPTLHDLIDKAVKAGVEIHC